MPTPLQRTRLFLQQPPGPYLFREEFPTDHAAGTLATYRAEPGPGRWAALDTNGKLSINGGALVGVTGGAANFDPSMVAVTPVSRIAGRLLLASVNVSANRLIVGWLNQPTLNTSLLSTARRGTIDLNGTALAIAQTGAGSIAVGAVALSTAYQLCVAMRPNGTQYFIKGGAFSNWTLIWVDGAINNVLAYVVCSYLGTTTAFTCDYIRVPNRQFLAIPLASDGFSSTGTDGLGHTEGQIGSYGSGGNGLSWSSNTGSWAASAGSYSATALSGGLAIATVDTSKADVIVTAKVTRSAGNAGIVLRYTDSANYVYAIHDGTNAELIKRVGGTETTLVNTAATYVAGAELRVICEGTAFRLFYNNAAVGTVQTIADAGLASGTKQGLYTSDMGNSFDEFAVYARGTGGEYAALDAF